MQKKSYKEKVKSNEEKFALNPVVPPEIDTHFQLYGKHMWEVNYTEKCPRCEKRVDEFGYCACNGFAE
ncbi:hypothetical protein [Candidatus Nitrosocosmicus hydrocola]|uniref:hypothetical protein n=1 Tax=Candidatus Nitrosocosmicus hydrocola TaxID=1826872 RepID=UPI0011E5C99B|nr:hypothetical protein [Candidatus Nitrosocosmicus hydrocola]